jgi:hypothetical protein
MQIGIFRKPTSAGNGHKKRVSLFPKNSVFFVFKVFFAREENLPVMS